MAEIQKVTMWAWRKVGGGGIDLNRPTTSARHAFRHVDYDGNEKEYGWIVPVEVIANTPENIEAIKVAALECDEVVGGLFQNGVDAVLHVLSLTGGKDA